MAIPDNWASYSEEYYKLRDTKSMFPRAKLNMLYLSLASTLRLVSSGYSPNNGVKNSKGQVGYNAKQLLLRQQNNDLIAAHVRPPLMVG